MPIAENGPLDLAFDVEGAGQPLLLTADTSADRGLSAYVGPHSVFSWRSGGSAGC